MIFIIYLIIGLMIGVGFICVGVKEIYGTINEIKESDPETISSLIDTIKGDQITCAVLSLSIVTVMLIFSAGFALAWPVILAVVYVGSYVIAKESAE